MPLESSFSVTYPNFSTFSLPIGVMCERDLTASITYSLCPPGTSLIICLLPVQIVAYMKELILSPKIFLSYIFYFILHTFNSNW